MAQPRYKKPGPISGYRNPFHFYLLDSYKGAKADRPNQSHNERIRLLAQQWQVTSVQQKMRYRQMARDYNNKIWAARLENWRQQQIEAGNNPEANLR